MCRFNFLIIVATGYHNVIRHYVVVVSVFILVNVITIIVGPNIRYFSWAVGNNKIYARFYSLSIKSGLVVMVCKIIINNIIIPYIFEFNISTVTTVTYII